VVLSGGRGSERQGERMYRYSMTVNGTQRRDGEGTLPVRDPATGQVCGEVPQCSPPVLDEAMEAARLAGPSWSKDEAARRDCLRRLADALHANRDELAAIVTAEQGKPLPDARTEVDRAAQWLGYYADVEMTPQVLRDGSGERVVAERRPLGVVAAITPWNSPVMLACWKLGPALRAGNTVVLKPSPFTPLSTLRMGELLAPALPAGVLNVISGGDRLGALMSEHPIPRKVSFTGSVATGKKVALAAAADLKRVTLELGGNDPAIILDDADPAKIADALFWSAFRNCGQVCSAVKRIYAPGRLYESVVAGLSERARSVRVGPGTQPGVQLGPISNRPQFDRVSELVADARDRRARVAAGGEPIAGTGNFYQPTILAGLSSGARVVDEEQFGPVLPVVAYDSLDDAVEQANATHFGLSASVWGGEPGRVAEVARALEAGRVGANVHPGIGPDLPFGGWKRSGIGVENGLPGLLEFTQMQVVFQESA